MHCHQSKANNLIESIDNNCVQPESINNAFRTDFDCIQTPYKISTSKIIRIFLILFWQTENEFISEQKSEYIEVSSHYKYYSRNVRKPTVPQTNGTITDVSNKSKIISKSSRIRRKKKRDKKRKQLKTEIKNAYKYYSKHNIDSSNDTQRFVHYCKITKHIQKATWRLCKSVIDNRCVNKRKLIVEKKRIWVSL